VGWGKHLGVGQGLALSALSVGGADCGCDAEAVIRA